VRVCVCVLVCVLVCDDDDDDGVGVLSAVSCLKVSRSCAQTKHPLGERKREAGSRRPNPCALA